MAIKNVEIQDSSGNIYHPHTDASVVKFGDSTVAAQMSKITNNINSAFSKVFPFSHDLTITGTQKITTPFKPKAIMAQAIRNGIAHAYCNGYCDENLNQHCVFDNNTTVPNAYANNPNMICIKLPSGAVIFGAVTLLEDEGFTITWSISGTPTETGVIDIRAIVLRQGGIV